MKTTILAAVMMVGCGSTDRFPPLGNEYPGPDQVSERCFSENLTGDAAPFGFDGGANETCLQACQALAGPDAASQCIQ